MNITLFQLWELFISILKRYYILLKGKKRPNIDSSTSVVSLSEWMHESTMFNIITNIHFFKHYANRKIFNTWKANTRYR